MYNSSMNEDVLKKYWYYIILVVVIFILLLIGADNKNGNTKLWCIGNKVNLSDNIYLENDNYYISLEDLEKCFSKNVFYDKISNKLIIVTWDNVLKLKESDEIKHENKIWYSINYIADKLGLDVVTDNNGIYLYNKKYIDAKIKSFRSELCDLESNNVIKIINKKDSIKIIEDENLTNSNKYVNVIVNSNKKSTVGKILKSKLEYDYIKEEQSNSLDKQIIVTLQDKLSSNTDLSKVTGIAAYALRFSYENKIVQEKISIPKGYEGKVYAILTNGYKLSNFDTDILTYMLNSDENKEKTIKSVVDYLNKNNLEAIVLDIKNFNNSDRDLLTQYIKELSASLHKNDKKIYVNVENTLSIDIEGINEFVDYIIVQAYGQRTLYSKTSGAYSDVTFVKNFIEKIKNMGISEEKLILEISPVSLLFSIRAGTIIDVEMYDMTSANEYVKLNNLKLLTDNKNKMHYIDYKKGIVTYKMFIEDEYSIKEKINLAKENGIMGISIYKSGYETKNVYDIISKGLE